MIFLTSKDEEPDEALGLALGADVPFFVFGAPALARGVGEKLTALSLPPFWVAVVAPPVSVPTATISPPCRPPSGPRSMTQSAVLMTSKLCSTTTTVLPPATRSRSVPISRSTSAACRPVVG